MKSSLLFALLLVSGATLLPCGSRAREVDLGTSYEFYVSVRDEQHRVKLLNDGVAALAARLSAIENARQEIDLETYIFTNDRAGRLVAQALADRARAGVQVRMVVDHWGSPDMDVKLDRELRSAGVHLRVYNTARAIQMRQVQFRTHRKLLVVDRKIVITGGRNVADQYFALHAQYNFMDRDVWIEGRAADVAARSFQMYWDSPISHALNPDDASDAGRDLARGLGQASAPQKSEPTKKSSWVVPDAKDLELRDTVMRAGTEVFNATPEFAVNHVLFTTPYPDWKTHLRGGPYYTAYYHLMKAQREVVIENPYFIPQGPEREQFLAAMNRGVRVRLLTNTLAAADSVIVAGLSWEKTQPLVRAGVDYRAYSGKPAPDQTWIDGPASRSVWGTHSKTMVVDGELSMVGTWNFDPRSRNLNAENAFVFPAQPALAQAILANIDLRESAAQQLRANGTFEGGGGAMDGVTFDKRLSHFFLGGLALAVQDFF